MSCDVLSRFDFYPTASLSEPPEIEFSKNLKWRGHYHNEETTAIQEMKCREQFYGFPPLATFFLSRLSLPANLEALAFTVSLDVLDDRHVRIVGAARTLRVRSERAEDA